ncbi:hypothetical protein E5A73_02680 [Sphingomonas gei]|uniref:DUF4760 domain-containing protein n=1 Tax=Sphingomonas gei TaxID=1395960 RepID=A0A4S1XJK6_9SPHN|nr:hypothetical protein [Sphingomonas gei]TGX56033.1 hypothetical protein E5A73_02680 [Sphingomonas gei]
MAALIAAASAIFAWLTVRSARIQFERTETREGRASIAGNYLALETASSEIFKYMAENHDRIGKLRGTVPDKVLGASKNAEALGVLLQLYYQSLNLFEVCARFRRDDLVKPEVFASWIAWMVEILEDSYFRRHWGALIRSNYTRDVRDIFDIGVDIFSRPLEEQLRNRAFYEAVGEIMGNCPVIANWLSDTKKATKWTDLTSHRKYLSNGTMQPASPVQLPISPAA